MKILKYRTLYDTAERGEKMKSKILFIVLAVVLVGAAVLVIALTSHITEATATRDIETALSESEKLAALESTPAASPMSAEGLSMLVQERGSRRDRLIPSLDGTWVAQAKTWESIEPDNFMEIKGKAVSKTNEIAKALFGCDITDSVIVFRYYTDTSKNRKDFVKVTTMDDAIVCVLSADTLDLIEIDYYFIPALVPELGPDKVTDNDRRIADKVAALFGTSVSDVQISGGTSALYATNTLDLTMKNGKFVKFATVNEELYAVGVYPTKACMTESVYFEADIQRDPSVVHLAAPQNFIPGEPGKGDMTKDEALSIYSKFLNLANGTGNYLTPTASFYIDKSGARENYWHLEGEMLTLDIASKSKWLVSVKCGGLWNPEKDLTGIPYESMGHGEYEAYVRNIMNGIYGDSLARVEPNAVYDSHYCTEDAVMADGAWYEFYFEDGKLKQVYYYFNAERFGWGSGGWKADSTYVNTVTGEEFFPGRW